MLRDSLLERIRIEALADDRTFTMKDGSLVSLVKLEGALRNRGRNELWDSACRLRIALSPFLAEPGHALKFTFCRDPEPGIRAIERLAEAELARAKSLDLRFDDFILSRRDCLSRSAVEETALVSVFTRPIARMGMQGGPPPPGAKPGELNSVTQAASAYSDDLLARHRALTSALADDLGSLGQMARVLEAAEALQEIRAALYPSTAAGKSEWVPDIGKCRRPDSDVESGSASGLHTLPDAIGDRAERVSESFFRHGIDWQLATEDGCVQSPQIARIGDSLFSAFDITAAPETLTPFNSLIDLLRSRGEPFPWRCCLLIEPGGLQAIRFKEQYARLFGFTAPVQNGRLRDAAEALRGIDGAEDTVVRLRMSFATWSRLDEISALRRNTAVLRRAAERWGNLSSDGVSGDPVATVLSSVPGISVESTAPVAAAPLSSALAMLPINRESSPWESGPVRLKTGDGRIWPYRPGSSGQNSWLDLFIGGSGSGKSVAMNAFCLCMALDAHSEGDNGSGLPCISIIDIGGSSKGLTSIISESLPLHRQHEAAHFKLRMHPSHAVNVFDTPMGMRRPLAGHKAFLRNFLAGLTGADQEIAGRALPGLISASIDLAYSAASEEGAPRRYQEGEDPAVDEALEGVGFRGGDYSTWWDAVDALFKGGRTKEAGAAQTRAVPVLTDLVSASLSEQISSLYGDLPEGEIASQELRTFHRVVSEAARDFPIISGRTQFSIGTARVVSLDLGEVTPSGGGESRRSAGLMMMLGRHLATRGWNLDCDEIEGAVQAGELPAMYREFHLKRAELNKRTPKLLCIDEFHRAAGIPALAAQVMRDIREGRKSNVRIALASQFPGDFDDGITQAASSAFIFGSSTESSLAELSRAFGFNEAECSIIRADLKGPTPDGTPLLAAFRHKSGVCIHKLLLSLGPVELWALTTTAEDVALRDRLFELMGPVSARRALACKFPSGSARVEMESRHRYAGGEVRDFLAPAARENIVEIIVGEMAK